MGRIAEDLDPELACQQEELVAVVRDVAVQTEGTSRTSSLLFGLFIKILQVLDSNLVVGPSFGLMCDAREDNH
jgi:hypothetical protein